MSDRYVWEQNIPQPTLRDVVLTTALSKPSSGFTLNPLGVAGFFGGDSAVRGMATANLIRNRRWFGWYNTPGSYQIAQKFGPLGRWKLCDGFFPGGEHHPARLFGLEGKEGAQFLAVHSGSNFARTGHLAYLHQEEGVWAGSVLCALVADWFCFASIALGILANGLACFVIGSGNLTFAHHKPAGKAPPGDGVLMGESDVVVLIGKEGAVNTFTRGHFQVEYRNQHVEQSKAHSNAGSSRSTPDDIPGLESQSDHPSQATLHADIQSESHMLE
ncbi:hypothetical protein BD311DRAFT_855495 [Dichomitus squalens]|uniref:Uncharacterized protein n=1 Tax=Dichomitus squalens TaxID=114155 RepID=A0A4Q9MEK3_9APHY|nr:hypothetical protein BD311DRAFT_855495 [Dichomitus squalens]